MDILWVPSIISETIKTAHRMSRGFRDDLEGTQLSFHGEIKKVMQRKLMLCWIVLYLKYLHDS